MDSRSQALARLSEGEKACLRRRLAGETAKESALAMGVSPHAVEKRLKMARAKLGLSYSLEAARLLEQVETERLVPQPGGLARAGRADAAVGGALGRALTGVLAMLLLALLAALPQASTPLPATSPRAVRLPVPPGNEPVHNVIFRPASAEEIRAFIRDSFRTMDKNRSGFIDRAEAPEGGIYTGPEAAPSLTVVHGRTGQAMTIAQADSDDDNRISEAEFIASRLPIFRDRGVPTNWRGAGTAATGVPPARISAH